MYIYIYLAYCLSPIAYHLSASAFMNQVVEPRQEAEMWFSATSMQEAEEKARKKLGVKTVKLEQDEDVLDTWFLVLSQRQGGSHV